MKPRPEPRSRAALVLAVSALCGAVPAAANGQEGAPIDRPNVGAFAFERVLTLPGPPSRVYDAITGDISGWWDHNFSGDPARFVIEPWPGGRFLEQFEEGSRDGVLHATVTFAKRPELLRLEGPLGLTGNAVHGVYSYRLEPTGDSTRLTLDVRMAGEMAEEWPAVVERVWRHFLTDGLAPYMRAGGRGGPEAEVEGHTLRIDSWPSVSIEVDSSLTYVGSRSFELYDVAAAETHVFLEAGPDSVVDRLYWFQVEQVLPASHHHYDYSRLPRTAAVAGLRFMADARFGAGYSEDTVAADGDTAQVLRLLAAAGYRIPAEMMRLRMVTVDVTGRRELLMIYLEDLRERGLSVAELEAGGTWPQVAERLEERALRGIRLR